MSPMHIANDESTLPKQGRLLPVSESESCLDSKQLQDLEQSFRLWATACKRPDHRESRDRILLIFLIIRYTGARLNEVLSLDLLEDFHFDNNTLRFCKKRGKQDVSSREVLIPETISADIKAITLDAGRRWPGNSILRIDPAHVRRKFYERAEAIGLTNSQGTPEVIRKSRAVELLRSNMPLPVIQKILGHASPHLAASYLLFSESEIHHVAKYFADRENSRRTSARNSFYGKITTMSTGEIQTLIEVVTISGNTISAMITNGSLARMVLTQGMLITAEVKAPWIQLCKDQTAPSCSAENMFQGNVCRVTKDRITAEIVVELPDGTELCAIISEKTRKKMNIQKNDRLWVFFDAFAVVLRKD